MNARTSRNLRRVRRERSDEFSGRGTGRRSVRRAASMSDRSDRVFALAKKLHESVMNYEEWYTKGMDNDLLADAEKGVLMYMKNIDAELKAIAKEF